jgi:hypothetical protein
VNYFPSGRERDRAARRQSLKRQPLASPCRAGRAVRSFREGRDLLPTTRSQGVTLMTHIRQVQPATVIATAALFVALGGTAYSAASTINGGEIKVHSIPGNRLELHTLTGTDINLQKLGTVPDASHANASSVATRALSVAAPAWHTISLQNGWTAAPFGQAKPAVTNDNGIIFLKGAMSSGGTNPVPFTLPAADRPTHVVDVPADMCTATGGRLQIEPDGVVTVEPEGGTFANAACFTSLDGIEFAP